MLNLAALWASFEIASYVSSACAGSFRNLHLVYGHSGESSLVSRSEASSNVAGDNIHLFYIVPYCRQSIVEVSSLRYTHNLRFSISRFDFPIDNEKSDPDSR